MTVGEFIAKAAEVLGKSAHTIFEAIMNANLASLVRLGIIIGVSVATVIMIFKFLRMKKKMYTNEKNKTVVDRALEVNYADVRNQEELHPLMKKVKKNLKKDLKPRVKNTAKKNREKYRTLINEIIDDRDAYDFYEDFEMFKKEMADKDRRRRRSDRGYYGPRDNQSLKTAWENC